MQIDESLIQIHQAEKSRKLQMSTLVLITMFEMGKMSVDGNHKKMAWKSLYYYTHLPKLIFLLEYLSRGHHFRFLQGGLQYQAAEFMVLA